MTETKKVITTKLWPESLQKLRIIKSLTRETQPAILERLLKEEIKRLRKEDILDQVV